MGKPARQHGMLSAAHPAAREKDHSGTRQPRVSGLLHRVQKCFYSFPANFLVFPAFVSCSVFHSYFWNGTQKLCCNHLIFAWIFRLPFIFFSPSLCPSQVSLLKSCFRGFSVNSDKYPAFHQAPKPLNLQYTIFSFPISLQYGLRVEWLQFVLLLAMILQHWELNSWVWCLKVNCL